jgi:hypothetical protein
MLGVGARRSPSVLLVALYAVAFVPYETNAQSAASTRLLDILRRTYPDVVADADGGVLVWKDGTRMPFDDSRPGKDFATLLDAPSLRDQFYAPYPTGEVTAPPRINEDPGRVRYQPFFDKMYGDCTKGEVSKHLVDVPWLSKKWGKTIKITSVNGVAEKLKAVSGELDALPERFDKYLLPPSGTYNCRVIVGTHRVSTHGSGIAIDIAVKYAHYWRWTKSDADGRYIWRNSIPNEIVAIFEKHGFIWGGKWYHFDTMHFEYRPELLAAGAE